MSSRILILLISLLFLGMTNCETERPKVDLKIYVGDSSVRALVRKQTNEIIRPEDEEFDDMLAVSTKDFSCMMNAYVFNCKQYSDPNYKCAP